MSNTAVTLTEQPPPLDKSRERIRDMFGRIAGRYDLLNHLLSAGIDRRWRRRAVQLAPPQGTAPILDICAGTGDLALAYSRAADEQTHIVAADFCHPMLVIGSRKGRRAGVDGRLRFIEADSLALPFRDERFQIVSVAFGLRNVGDTGRGLSEMVRVCRQGGKVVILEFSLPRRQPMRGLYRWYFHHVLPRVAGMLARDTDGAYNYLPQSVEQFPSGAELVERMRAAGLSRVSHYPLTLGIATLYVGTK